MKLIKNRTAKTLITFSLLAIATTVYATEKMTFETADAAIEYRQNMMDEIKSKVKTLDNLVKGRVTWDYSAFNKAATELNAIATKSWDGYDSKETALGVYQGSLDVHAKQDIWDNSDDFAQKITAFQTATNLLMTQSLLNNKETSIADFSNVQKACGSCHKPYKKN